MSSARLTLAAALLASVAACKSEPPAPPPAPAPAPAPSPAPKGPVAINEAVLGAFAALPAEMAAESNPVTPEKVALGRMLYYENRLSKNHDVSCNSCHGLDAYGVDNKPTSSGHRGLLGGRNSPTVYNAALHVAQFWDGRAATVEDQAKGPILNPIEMAMPSEAKVVETLSSMPEYVDAFKAAFPGEKSPVTYENLAKAIGAFERRLVTPSRWDKFLAGDKAALTEAEKAGFNAFVEVGCTACHMGPGLGGQMYQKAGLLQPWPNQKDAGRFEVTKNEADRLHFKVPSLRNVAKTQPYFHDGSVASLDEAVAMMARHQLGKELAEPQRASIVAFLNALTGELPTEYIAKPALPPSTAKTPKPDPS
jgi:cytochrome c peroxidase